MNDYNFITHPYSLKKYSIYSSKGNNILNKFIQYAGLIYTQKKCNEIKLELQEKPEICHPQENPDYCRDYRDNTNWCINVKNNIDNIPMYCHPDEYYEDCQN